jgi:hypothetical protein
VRDLAARVEARFAAGSRLGAIATAAIGAMGLAGWAFDLPRLTSVVPGLVTMKANAAAGLVALGAAVLLLHAEPRAAACKRAATLAAVALGGFAAVLGALTLSQDVGGWNFNIDQALFREPAGAAHTGQPGRMSPGSALAFVLAGCSVAAFAREAEWARYVGQSLAAAAGAIGLVVLVGYLLDVQALYRVRAFSAMSLNTAVAFVVLALALLAARAGHGWMREFAAATHAAQLARRLAFVGPALLASVAIPKRCSRAPRRRCSPRSKAGSATPSAIRLSAPPRASGCPSSPRSEARSRTASCSCTINRR